MAKNIDYTKRTFSEIKNELHDFIKENYPSVYSDFEDSSVGSMLTDVCAAVGDMLSFNTDRAFQETQLGSTQIKRNMLAHAKTMGVKLPNKRASVSIVEFTVTVPTSGGSFATNYLPILKSGAQVMGNGKVFETINEIDFSSPYSSHGTPNRLIIPIHDVTNKIVRYEITKKEVVYNGISRIYKKVISPEEVTPFMKLTLVDPSVLNIVSVIAKDGYVEGLPSDDEFNDDTNRFHEVDHLAQQKVFFEKDSDGDTIKAGEWTKVTRKFTKEFSERGYCTLTFGGGNGDLELFNDAIRNDNGFDSLENYLLNNALGEMPKGNTTLFVKYRVGGGSESNVGRNVLNSMGAHRIEIPDAPSAAVAQAVKISLRVTNPIPAFGGRDSYSIEEMRHIISYNFAAQGRAVTLKDYLGKVYEMEGKYGSPFKATAFVENNMVVISILGVSADGKLSNTTNRLLQSNIENWLSGFKMVNDYIDVRSGKIYNLGFDVEVYGENRANSTELVTRVVNEVSNFLDVYKRSMNEDIFLGMLIEAINNIPGILNVLSLRVYNKRTGDYSPNTLPMTIKDETTGEVELVNNTIFSSPDGMFEVKHPNRDIRVTVKKSIGTL
jgi:hypothetical protein